MFILTRALQLTVVLFVVSALTFLLLDLLPGDPVHAILGLRATEEAVARLTAELSLDQPVHIRYLDWLGAALRGDLGSSYINHVPTAQAIAEHLPVTLQLVAVSQAIALAIAVPLGVYSAHRPNGWVDRLASGFTFATLSVPPFMMGVLLVFVFAVTFNVFPATGYTSFGADPAQALRSLFLPALTLALGSLAVYVRALRADMIATLRQDHVTTARAKGVPARTILWRHALRSSSLSLVTVVALHVGALTGGAILVEQIFALPGIGQLTVNSIFQHDYLVLQSCVLVIAVSYVLVTFLADLLYPLLDPRTRHG
ncbi:peptide ABC transporter [Spongiactinospora gelatinilytica]|uniref:Peptide ABC transporter n=1 Tax=Spongiactinospora gelatinilytica TaxID=2666298 RepID=A0A2W2HL83_9ACTN|nr:ABC transporter permease [Spongiactinospora gelatinilytica]PZG46677.1 peptide ABC transporter [Spongiactinospora gelatinilytica]